MHFIFESMGLGCSVCCTAWIVVGLPVVGLIFSTLFLTPKFNYKGKHVMITGGSSGIGLEAAREYLRLGANVTIVARDLSRLKSAQIDLQNSLKPNSSQKVLIASLDTSKGQEIVDAGLQPSILELGDVDVLVNCAGVSIAGEFESLDVNEFERMLKINVLGE